MRTSRSIRSLVVLVALASLVLGIVPAQALGTVTLTWERNWGSTGLLPGQFTVPPDVATDKWGNVYVAGGENHDDRIQMFDADGTFIKSVGTTGEPNTGIVRMPRALTTDRWGTIYVAEKETGASNIHLFNPLLYSDLGRFHTNATDAINGPNGIAVALDGTTYVSDWGTSLQRWRNRDLVNQWAPAGVSVYGVCVTQDGVVLATTDVDSGITNSVIQYSFAGVFQKSWGGLGTAPGEFNRPYDIGADPLGNSYVIESEGSRGQVFAPDGTHLTTFGSSGVGDGQFYLPYGIGVGLDRTVYVADTNNNRISKWNVTIPTESTQVAGDSRYTTAIEASKRAYPDGAKMVVISTGENWPDALGGASLAGAVGAPLLLTPKNALPVAVHEEIERLHATGAYILGSEAAVSAAVYDAVDALMILTPPVRLGGGDRYATANLIATETVERVNADKGYDGTAFVATGENFPDALAASPIAAANGWPIYLTRKSGLPASVKAAMEANISNHGYILGSTDAVSAAVATELSLAPFISFGRYEGPNRYATAAAIASIGYDGMGMLWSRPALAVGTNFPDALAGGVLQGSDCSVLLLTPGSSLDPYAAAALEANRDMIYEMRFLGGASALGTAPRTAAMALLW
jgi:putative cell wall-binding protein